MLQIVQPTQHPRGQARLDDDTQFAVVRGRGRHANGFQPTSLGYAARCADDFRRLVALDWKGEFYAVAETPTLALPRSRGGRSGCRKDNLHTFRFLADLNHPIHFHLTGYIQFGGRRIVAADECSALHIRGNRHIAHRAAGGVLGQHADAHPIPGGEETGQNRTQEQRFAGGQVIEGVTHTGIVADPPHGQPPGGQIVGQGDAESGYAVCICHQPGPPDRKVSEVLAQAQRAAITTTAATFAPFAQLLVEPVLVDCEQCAGRDAQGQLIVELVHQRAIVAHGQTEHGLVHQGHAQFRAGDGRAAVVGDGQRISHSIPRTNCSLP